MQRVASPLGVRACTSINLRRAVVYWTVKNSRREVPPVLPEVPGLVTESGTIPGDEISSAGTVTVMLLSLPEIRFSLTVPKFTQASDWKFSPKIVRLNAPDPAKRLAGLSGLSVRMIGMPETVPDVTTNSTSFE
jgi:hypothetical protein